MVKRVEELAAKLESFRLRQPHLLKDAQGEIIEARAVEEAAVGVPESAQVLLGEQQRVEIGLPGPWVGNVQRAGGEIGHIYALTGGAGEARAQQGIVVALADVYG